MPANATTKHSTILKMSVSNALLNSEAQLLEQIYKIHSIRCWLQGVQSPSDSSPEEEVLS